ncbi:cutinase family protein [Nocardia sp. CA2R105]|nr:cutinase family protein [Nocardia coffeae]
MVASSWTVAAALTPVQASAASGGSGCPALFVLGVQGTGQSNPAASHTADTGLLGALLGPVMAAAPNLVQRSYISYDAGFGGVVGAGTESYATSVTGAVNGLIDAINHEATTCPTTKLAAVGYSQGAQAVSTVAQQIGGGHGLVPSDRIAAIILYGDPDRSPGSPVFPGRPGQTRPDRVPGSVETAVSTVQISVPRAGGGGIGTGGQRFGALTGRVAEVCDDADLACASPDRAALFQFAARLVAQADLRDPVAALASLNNLLRTALGAAWTTILDQDIVVDNRAVTYRPRKPLSQRLIDAADPRTPVPNRTQTDSASGHLAQINAAVSADPIGVLPALAGQLAGAIGGLAADDADMSNPAVWAHFAGTVAAHTGYAATGELASGIAWLTAAAHDIAGSHP